MRKSKRSPPLQLESLVRWINLDVEALEAVQTEVYRHDPDTNAVYQALGDDVLSTLWRNTEEHLSRLTHRLDRLLAEHGQELADHPPANDQGTKPSTV